MFRRSALPTAVAGIGVVLLALAGSKVQVQDASPAGTTDGATGAAVTGPASISRAGSLTIEPGAGFSPVYNLIGKARHSINVTMYEFSDTTAEHDLGAAAKRGVQVRVILDRRAKSINSGAYSYFRSHDVKVTWSSSDYRYTHQKTVSADGSEAIIMTANLTSKYYATSRDFLVTDTDRADVSAITRVFDADFAKHSVQPGDGSDLVWSPTDSQDQMIAVINGARSSLRIYSEEMGDATVEKRRVRQGLRQAGQGRRPDQLLQLLQGLLHPRQGHRGRLRHQPRQGLHRVGELLQHFPHQNRELGRSPPATP
jgi:phosphatidylserine/phosphatidylglycerophosphate/cardiolipin synthase-like enzyme